jgi:hypothetical protein
MANTGNRVFIDQITIRGPTMINATTVITARIMIPTLYFIIDLLQSLQFIQFTLDGLVLPAHAHGGALLVDPPHMLFAV